MTVREQAEALALLHRFAKILAIMDGQKPGEGNNPINVVKELRGVYTDTKAFLALTTVTVDA